MRHRDGTVTDKIIERQLDFLGHAYNTVLNSVKELQFDSESPAHVLAIALHGTIVEPAAACISALNTGNIIAVPILLRSMTEALVDQINLLTDAEYVKNIQAANLKETERLLVQAGDESNVLLGRLRETLDVPKELQELRAQLEALRKEGHGELKVFERFRRAGMEFDYRSAYVLLCLDTHSNASALVERHVEKHGDRLELSIFKEPRVNSIRARIDAVTAMLL